jgi:hypothetical protein
MGYSDCEGFDRSVFQHRRAVSVFALPSEDPIAKMRVALTSHRHTAVNMAMMEQLERCIKYYLVPTTTDHRHPRSISISSQSSSSPKTFISCLSLSNICRMHLPQLRSTFAVPVLAMLLLSPCETQAMPTTTASAVSEAFALQPRTVEARGWNGMGVVTLALAVKEFLKDKNAYVRSFFSPRSTVYNQLTCLTGSNRS